MSNSFKLTDDIIGQLDLLKGLIECRDRAVRYGLFARRAVYYAKRAEKLQRKIWRRINKLHPETQNGRWSILADVGIVCSDDEESRSLSWVDELVH